MPIGTVFLGYLGIDPCGRNMDGYALFSSTGYGSRHMVLVGTFTTFHIACAISIGTCLGENTCRSTRGFSHPRTVSLEAQSINCAGGQILGPGQAACSKSEFLRPASCHLMQKQFSDLVDSKKIYPAPKSFVSKIVSIFDRRDDCRRCRNCLSQSKGNFNQRKVNQMCVSNGS